MDKARGLLSLRWTSNNLELRVGSFHTGCRLGYVWFLKMPDFQEKQGLVAWTSPKLLDITSPNIPNSTLHT